MTETKVAWFIKLFDLFGPPIGGFIDEFKQTILKYGGEVPKRGKYELESSYAIKIQKAYLDVLLKELFRKVDLIYGTKEDK